MTADTPARGDADPVHRAHLSHQLLTRPLTAAGGTGTDLAVAVVGHLLAVQAQDGRGARLALRSRTAPAALDAADVDAALAERRLVVSWLNRGTLHLVRAEDEPWLHLLCAPRQATANARRLQQEGVSPDEADRAVDLLVDTLTAGPATRAELGARLDAAGVRTAGQALVQLLNAATIRGHLVRGPMVGGQQAFVLAETWLGPRPVVERDEALARLAHRYLVGHGPADARDLATWAGLPLGDARRALAAVPALGHDLCDHGDGRVGLEAATVAPAPGVPAPRLLGPFDPLLHGWASRADVVGPHRGIVTTNGIFRPIALVDGRAVATWSLAAGVLTIHPLEPIPAPARAALDADAADVLRYLGLPPRPAGWDDDGPGSPPGDVVSRERPGDTRAARSRPGSPTR